MSGFEFRPGDFQRFLNTPPEFLRDTFVRHEQTFGRKDLEQEVRRMFNSAGVDVL